VRRPVKRAFTIVAMLFTLVFSQLWISAYACATAAPAPSSGLTVSVASATNHGDLRDHHTGMTCHAHCDNNAQPDHAEQLAPSPVVWLPLIWGHSSILALASQPHLLARSEPILISAPPPLRIQFQVFRT
jgi:hypothetical protein